MAIKDEDIGFGAATVKVNAPRRSLRRKVKYTCENCGSDEIKRKYWCSWDIVNQQWAFEDICENDGDYCDDCGCSMCEADQVRIPLPKV